MNMPQFTADASLYRTERRYQASSGLLAADHSGQVFPALVGRWPIPGTQCEVNCIEVCTRFCGPTGWDCCNWETRCATTCQGPVNHIVPQGS
jgi:hypothetical protein